MLATLTKSVPSGEGWFYERKYDGLRCICIKSGDDVQLMSRNQLSFNARFPEVIESVCALAVHDVVLDGELVTFDASDRTSFSLLQQGVRGAAGVQFQVFDILQLLGNDTVSLPIEERKQLVYRLLTDSSDVIHAVRPLQGDPTDLMRAACEGGWEGLIAKRVGSAYTFGRSSSWLKHKCTASQELVVGGWTEPRGARVGFGALLLGYFDSPGSRKFHYAGKVGTGFDSKLLTSLYADLLLLEQSESPFFETPKEKAVHWVKPQLVANIGFAEWTRDGRLRHPTFQVLRSDKEASSVIREA